MKPIYFPFTYVPEPAAEALSLFFRQIVVYQPSSLKIPEKMQDGAESGFLDIRIPVTGDETKLDSVLKHYINWTNIHKKDNLTFFRPWTEKTPFWDNTSVSQIKAEIKNKPPMKPDLLFNARIFLHIAQDLDIQEMEISTDLFSVEAMQKDLLKSMKGEEELLGDETIGLDTSEISDFGSYMTAERLDAWARLFQQDAEPSVLFITTSPAVFDHLMEKAPESKMVLHFDSIPLQKNPTEKTEHWKNRLKEHLDTFEKDEQPGLTPDIIPTSDADPDSRTVSLRLYQVLGKTPTDFFRPFIIRDKSQAHPKKEDQKLNHTLVGLLV